MKLFKAAPVAVPETILVETMDGEEVRAEFLGGPTVLETLLHNKIEVSTSCGGMGTCGTCRIEVIQGLAALGDRNEIEAEIADARGFAACERLACQVQAHPELKIRIPQEKD